MQERDLCSHGNDLSTGWSKKYMTLFCYHRLIGHFQVATSRNEEPLLWKLFFILMQIKLIFTTNVLHVASCWKWEFLELGNGLLKGVDSYIYSCHFFRLSRTWLTKILPNLYARRFGIIGHLQIIATTETFIMTPARKELHICPWSRKMVTLFLRPRR